MATTHPLPNSLKEQATNILQQSFTCFLALPLEIRSQIYAYHFRSLTLIYPTFTLPPILFTSHQIHTEALRYLRPNATYNLLTTEHFIDYLTTLTPASLAQLRHISLRSYPLPVYHDDDDSSYTTHLFPSVPPLFPGLRLDTLEVVDAFHGKDVDEDGWGHDATYHEMEEMIKNGTGWKELIFRSASDRWLKPVVFQTSAVDGTMMTEETSRRSAQPGAWDTMVKVRDGEESGAGVEIWTSEEEGVWKKAEGNNITDVEGRGNDDSEVEDDDKSSSIEVRVRRGKGAEYVQGGRPVEELEHRRKLREMFEKLGWKEIKARELFIAGAEDDPCAHL